MLHDYQGNEFTLVNLLNFWVTNEDFVVFTPENLITNKEDALQKLKNYSKNNEDKNDILILTSKNYINHSYYKNEILKEMNKINDFAFQLPYKEDTVLKTSLVSMSKSNSKVSVNKVSKVVPKTTFNKVSKSQITEFNDNSNHSSTKSRKSNSPFSSKVNTIPDEVDVPKSKFDEDPFDDGEYPSPPREEVVDEDPFNDDENRSPSPSPRQNEDSEEFSDDEKDKVKNKFPIPKVHPNNVSKTSINFKLPKTVSNPIVNGINPFIEDRSSSKMEIPSTLNKKIPTNPFNSSMSSSNNEIDSNSQMQFNNAGIPGISSFKPKQTFVPTAKTTTSTRGKRGIVKTPDQHLIDLFANSANADKALDLSKYATDGKITKVKASTGTVKSRSTKIYSTMFPQIKSDNWEGVFMFFANLTPEIFSELLPILMDLANSFQRAGKMVSNYDSIAERFSEEGEPTYQAHSFIMPISDNNLIDNKKPSFQGGTPLTNSNMKLPQLPQMPKSSNQNYNFPNSKSVKHKA